VTNGGEKKLNLILA